MTSLTTDTICAIATATGGAIGVIRVSGPQAIHIADSIFTPIGPQAAPLRQRQPYTLAFGRIVDAQGQVVDEVLASVFRAPHSYTGEDAVELSCHGSAYILQRVMQLLFQHGCRAAGPGEYTQRAFLNGKMDLAQAEAVADLIASTTAAAHRMAMNQMRGAFSTELASLRQRLLHLTSLMELELDFSDHEELEFADRHELDEVATHINTVILGLMASFRQGNAIKNGVPVAIIGETNAGKSTLLNQLVGDERAIVSDIHGTTRDVIEDTISVNGVNFRFIDTAGIRDTTDQIENLGIERTLQKASQAQIVILLLDATCAQRQLDNLQDKVLPLCEDKALVVALNKCDLGACPALRLPCSATQIQLSAKRGDGIDRLKALLCQMAGADSQNESGVIVSNVRHFNALCLAHDDITRVIEGLRDGLPSDLVSQDLRDCIHHLGEITGGEIQTDEVLGNIFKHFCVGK